MEMRKLTHIFTLILSSWIINEDSLFFKKTKAII